MMGRFLIPIVLSAGLAIPGMLYLGRAATAQRESLTSSTADAPITVDFGVLRQGESAVHRCWFRNPGVTTVEIEEFKSSCECVTVSTGEKTIVEGERALLTVRYDGAADLVFAGSLAVAIELLGPGKRPVGHIIAYVEVLGAGEE